MGSVFRFKLFEVDQSGCAMKIGTDGVLLGAWTRCGDARRILDIGTGTGVVALMLAQAHPEAWVDALEIDSGAAVRAEQNFAHSPFRERMRVFGASFADFRPRERYDLIVSNPPFYTDSLHSADERRRTAKHADVPFFERLFAFVADWLVDEGLFSFILPASLTDRMAAEKLLERNGLFCRSVLSVSSYPHGSAIRKIIAAGKERTAVRESDFFIYSAPGIHSPAYKTLLAPYFLAY